MGRSRRKLDLVGQKFGRLTVVAPVDNIGSRTAWRCRCDCGREAVVKTVRLRSGRTVSCGCSRAESGAGPEVYALRASRTTGGGRFV